MKFALLIYSDESAAPMPETPEAQRVFDEYLAFTTGITESGISRGGEAFHDSGAAVTVQVVDGEVVVTDAPAVDSREALGGFYSDRGTGRGGRYCRRRRTPRIALRIGRGSTGLVLGVSRWVFWCPRW